MRAGGAYHRINFFAKQVTRDAYGSSSDSWNYSLPTISTRGEVRYTGGSQILNSDEKFYSKNVELIIRYRDSITETMRVQIDDTNNLWMITYMEMLGRKESIRLTIEKLVDNLGTMPVDPPTSFAATLDSILNEIGGSTLAIDLTWVNNASNDGIIIERSRDGVHFREIARVSKAVTPVTIYKDENLDEETQYFYRAKAFFNHNFSIYTSIVYATTTIYIT